MGKLYYAGISLPEKGKHVAQTIFEALWIKGEEKNY
jgi:hypothetical protein